VSLDDPLDLQMKLALGAHLLRELGAPFVSLAKLLEQLGALVCRAARRVAVRRTGHVRTVSRPRAKLIGAKRQITRCFPHGALRVYPDDR